MEQRLNTEQQKLVAEHHDVIYKVLGRCNLNIDEYYGIASVALCNAAIGWTDNGTATFETFATVCIKHAIANEIRRQSSKKHTALKRVPFSEAERIGSRVFDPDLYAELGLFDEPKHKI